MADKALGVGATCCGESCGLAGCDPNAPAQSYAKVVVDFDELLDDEEDD